MILADVLLYTYLSFLNTRTTIMQTTDVVDCVLITDDNSNSDFVNCAIAFLIVMQ